MRNTRTVTMQLLSIPENVLDFQNLTNKFWTYPKSFSNLQSLIKGALIQGRWYMHILSLLASTCIGTCMYYLQPLGTCTYQPLNSLYRYMHVPRSVQRYVHVPWSVMRYVHAPKQTYLIHKFIEFRGCLEAPTERSS